MPENDKMQNNDRELTPEQLENVAGGVTAPRDAASGMPTGFADDWEAPVTIVQKTPTKG
jgi:hypothetical protein